MVSALLSMSATETPAIGRMVSSATLCAPGTVLIGGVGQGGDRDDCRLHGGTVIIPVMQTPPQRARRVGAEARRILAGRAESGTACM